MRVRTRSISRSGNIALDSQIRAAMTECGMQKTKEANSNLFPLVPFLPTTSRPTCRLASLSIHSEAHADHPRAVPDRFPHPSSLSLSSNLSPDQPLHRSKDASHSSTRRRDQSGNSRRLARNRTSFRLTPLPHSTFSR